jgi:hypothetical protein
MQGATQNNNKKKSSQNNNKKKRKLIEMANHTLKKSQKKKIILTFCKIVTKLTEIIESFPDNRTGTNTSVKIKDAAMAVFSLFFTQSPSFLDFQRTMQLTKGKNNAQSLFGVYRIHSDNAIRKILDPVHPKHVSPVFDFIHKGMHQSGYMDDFRYLNGHLLVALDGIQYHSSKTIRCDKCSSKTHQDGNITYSHSAVAPVIVKPGINLVIPFQPECITPQDGHNKQDCEIAAGKRWLQANGRDLKNLPAIIMGDDLYCKQPFCELLFEQELDFILICKEESHKTLYEYVRFQKEDITTITEERFIGKRCEIDTYRFINGVPLRDGEDALQVNWCEIVTTDKNTGDVKYKNSFATNIEINNKNVKNIVKAGRARWKIENENNNVLKNRGYHLEHNFGHGEENLSALFLSLNILAFLIHTVLDMMDEKYQFIRRILPSRMTFFNHIRTLTCYIYFDSWEQLMKFMIKGFESKGEGDNY